MKPPIDLSSYSPAQKDALIGKLFEQVSVLQQQLKALQAQLGLNSTNSSKSSSTDDGYNKPKPKSRRNKSGKSSGGQPGHKGSTLERSANPDHIVEHTVEQCSGCGFDLRALPVEGIEARQVFDIPPIQIAVTEHQAHIKCCPCCRARNKGAFPAHVGQPVQYGPEVQAVVTYLSQYQMLPYQRLKQCLEDLFQLSLSEGTVNNILRRGHKALQGFEEHSRTLVGASVVAHFDESGLRVGKALHWLHVASTESLTCYFHHPKRGSEAMREMGVLEGFGGYAVHDHFSSYFCFAILHVLCGAHILRELISAHEQHEQAWAKKMIACLLDAKKEVDTAVAAGATTLDSSRIDYYEARYRRILKAAVAELPADPIPIGATRGKKKRHKVKNLHARLDEYQPEVLAFVYDLTLPFDNNLAERDVRMVKVKQKVSGCFRSSEGADMFCRIRGYISTAKKQGRHVLGSLRDCFHGQPFNPATV